MLGRLDMSVRDAITAYRMVAQEAFRPKHRISIPAPPSGMFSATSLEGAIKTVIGTYCQDPACVSERAVNQSSAAPCSHQEKLFRDDTCRKTAVLAITKDNVDAPATLFKTYDKSTSFKNCKIWEVVRATSAATTFFKSIKCGMDEIEFIDAGFGYNNPCDVLVGEAKQVFPDAQQILVVSIGTGMGNVVDIRNTRRSILGALQSMASNSSRVAREMAVRYRGSNDYFRFNVEQGLQDVTLSDWEQTSRISAHTHNYILENEARLEQCALRLVQLQSGARAAVQEVVVPGAGGVGTIPEMPAAETSQELPQQPENESSSRMAEPTASQSIREIFVVPLDSNKNYVHREALESSLASILAPEDKKERQCKRAALCGLGGSGKTQIAVRFAQDYRSFYSAVFWVSGLDEASLIDGFCYLAREVGVGTGQISEGNVDMATDWLVSNIGWLLIIDNVDSEEALRVLHRKFLTAGMRGSILITSRNELVKLRWTTIDVGNMSEAEGGQLLANITGAEDAAEGPVSDLLQSLGCLPLAIDQAASYIREAEVSVAEYLDLYHQEKTECLKPRNRHNDLDHLVRRH
ncbi:hypothetical protein NW755_001090 [Fusarium falciforme]|uniref:PNPLA domain-containing protein n=1 Tax=Fusarium falciforme TaxID=195108 RepID=A0A9W8RL48_9HYPO|nr:hypothetical protein NW755_001090 [Fusarium falciforme]